MISKKLSKKSLLYSTVALSMFAAGQAQADETTWTPRSVEEIQAGLVTDGNTVTYTVQYGDTLSTIAQAMNIDVNVLGNINKIADLDLIFPETVLTATYNDQNQVAAVEVETPVSPGSDETIKATADLENNQVVVEDQTVSVADLTQAIVDTTTEQAYAETTTPVADAIAQVTESQASSETSAASETEVTSQAPVAETTLAETTEVSPVETSETTVEETSASQVSSETTETAVETSSETSVAETTEATTEETTVAETTETPVEETSAETTVAELTQAIVSETTAAQTYAETTEPVTEAINQVIEASETTEATTEETTVAEATQATTAASATNNVTINTENMQAPAAAFAQTVANVFGISNIGGYRAGDPQDHGKGLAVDVMVPESSALGDQVAQYAIDHMAENGISYIIWKQRFYSPYNSIYGPANTWNPMPDRGSVTENHYDHVHVSFNG
ncbi:LysM peptidoglycan-binding domain-containing protein [Streptococcus loxodontisalivarius]|uniref:Chemotaxis protein histidine kinase CheA n=1 Tax=Streptococcus loxodontisalivarius TaxID=1349415 RepID=A0ABS2PQX2_9STRE|nr:LysM domain-containing protein [Streptococcus loxodontisalivarius]MBM7642311.1 chemotaxis protein histidine kinase CheA [Streptococcus loxodontisalivarius]